MKNNFFYKKTGNSPKTILLIHGWSHSSSVWNKIVPTLSKKYTVISIDLLGHGKSPSPYQKDNLLDFLAQELFLFIKEQKWEINGIIAHSMGGVITLKMLKKYKMNIDNLMIIGSPFNGLPLWIKALGKIDKFVNAVLTFKKKFSKKINDKIVKLVSRLTIKDINCLIPELTSDISMVSPYYASKLLKELSTPSFELNEELSVKSAIISRGELDILSSREDLTKLTRFLKGKYYQFSNVSHTVPLEAPDELLEVIFKLLD